MKNVFFRRSDVWLIGAAMAGIAYFIFSYPSIYPDIAVEKLLSYDAARIRATQWMQSGRLILPPRMDSLEHRVDSYMDRNRILYLQEKLGLEKANQLIRSIMPAYGWRAIWYRETSGNFRFGSSNEDEPGARPRGNPAGRRGAPGAVRL